MRLPGAVMLSGAGAVCRVEWELWTSTNDGCGSSCDRQATFKIQMRDAAVELQKVPRHSHRASPRIAFPAPIMAVIAGPWRLIKEQLAVLL